MMDWSKILLAALIGTTLMTLFSFFVSDTTRKMFKEPVLLNILLDRTGLVNINDSLRNVLGYILHYLVGIVFVIGFDLAWAYTALDPNWASGILLGAVAGLVGILIWVITFKIHPHEPKIHFKEYYLQLFFAHILLALGATAVYMYY